MKRFFTVSLALVLTIASALPASALTIDHAPVLIETTETGGAFSLTVENLPELFEVNKKSTADYELEYAYEIMFFDGTAFFNVGVSHAKYSGQQTRTTTLFEQSSLFRGDGQISSFVGACSFERDGDIVTYFLEDPISDRDGYTVEIDYENISAFGYSITGEQNVYYRILVGGGLEELTWEQYYALLP